MFNKEERSSFKYWFAHWCAYQMTALNLRAWHARYLFHDIEKPFLKLIMPYEKVKRYHRKHAKHHLEYFFFDRYKTDYEGMVIDWESSRFTKAAAQMNAMETFVYELGRHFPDYIPSDEYYIYDSWNVIPSFITSNQTLGTLFVNKIGSVLMRLGLWNSQIWNQYCNDYSNSSHRKI